MLVGLCVLGGAFIAGGDTDVGRTIGSNVGLGVGKVGVDVGGGGSGEFVSYSPPEEAMKLEENVGSVVVVTEVMHVGPMVAMSELLVDVGVSEAPDVGRCDGSFEGVKMFVG